MTQVTKDQIKAAIQITLAIADAIRELGEVPSGHLYARIGHLSIEDYNSIIDILKRGGLVKEQHHLLTWIGPKPDEGRPKQ
jgi:hypothetical protein